ncbi:FUSC family membrane protein [Parapedobacter sp. DT-150]|uniref:FUSC family membrane protein n=1 Tax=Parapedobacter sp. DT-150 TaxID=3396162 RepID=UPI003F1B63B4
MRRKRTVFNKVPLCLSGEHGGDALRNTLCAIVPGVVFYWLGQADMAVAAGMGSLLVSLTDVPGNRGDKWRSACWSMFLFFTTALAVAACLPYPWVLVVLLIILAFALTMLSVFGQRFAVMGMMALILSAFTIGLRPTQPLVFGIYVTIGVIWYYLISLIQVYISPFRSLRYSLDNGFRSTAALLRAKVLCYDESVPVEKAYQRISALHVRVSDQQELVRHLLLRDKKLIDVANKQAVHWMVRTYGLMDLYELVTALDHDYESIRGALAPVGALPHVRELIALLAEDVEALAELRANGKEDGWEGRVLTIKRTISRLEGLCGTHPGEPAQILGAIIRNVQQIIHCIGRIRSAANDVLPRPALSKQIDYRPFLSLPLGGWRAFRTQLSFRNQVFPFALRLALLFGLGGLIGLALPADRYAYWILLTVVIVARPGFAMTQRRNFQRILGTLGGVLLGLLLLYLVSDVRVLLVTAAVFLYGFFAFNRLNYMISVLCITPAVIIGLHLYEGDMVDILGSRVVFTLMGCLLAIGGWYLVPVRQSHNLDALARAVTGKNQDYFRTVIKRWLGDVTDGYGVRLARKEAHTALASFSDVVQQLQREPGRNKQDWETIHAFHMLAYRVNALITGLSLAGSGITDLSDAESQDRDPRVVYLKQLLVTLGSRQSLLTQR